LVVAEAHGGAIAALSSEGSGSDFRICIPDLTPVAADKSLIELAAASSAG
jgi:hypothetical protein